MRSDLLNEYNRLTVADKAFLWIAGATGLAVVLSFLIVGFCL